MNNPELKILAIKNTWYKIASSVSSGIINIKAYQNLSYKYTYKIAGDPAPTSFEESVVPHSNQIEINSSEYIDVYMACVNNNGEVVISI